MKYFNSLLAAAALIGGLIVFSSCKGGGNKVVEAAEEEVCEISVPTVEETAFDYMAEVFGSQYAPGEYCIPCGTIVAKDESNPEDIRLWGDYWVFIYNKEGDLLKMVSGGSHPGLMHLCKTDGGYKVTGFDGVVDGAGNLESAKAIFGEHYDAFHAINSDAPAREKVRCDAVSAFVKAAGMDVKGYQDFGWDPVLF